MNIEALRKKASDLPLSPGVYIMKNNEAAIIYVGKAKKLKNRVLQYFLDGDQTPKVRAMINKVSDFEVIIAKSEFEALVLENILIKKHQPKYNIRLKDDKGYPFIKINMHDEYPMFEIAGKRSDDGARYYGPYSSRITAHSATDTISRALKLPSCSRKFPADIGRNRPCLNAQMNRCIALCSGKVSSAEYRKLIQEALLMLEGSYAELEAALGKNMSEAAENMEFERAAAIRDRLSAIRNLGSKQIIINDRIKDADAAAFYADENGAAIVLLSLRGGAVIGKYTVFSDDAVAEDGTEMLTDFILQYYGNSDEIPKYIYLSEDPEDIESISQLLSEKSGGKVYLAVPKRGEKHAIIDMALENAKDELTRRRTTEQKATKTAAELAEITGLPTIPNRIEAYDISNTGNDSIVASMTVFFRGKPLKRDYRKYKIKSKDTQDDYLSMREVITRRLMAYKENREGFNIRPDLILVDGGRGQAAAAETAMIETGIKIPVLGMKKDDRHRTKSLVNSSGEEIGLQNKPAVFVLVGNIQEETHRYAIEFHRKLRDKSKIKSSLDNIDGIGEKRREKLLIEYKSAAGVKRASRESLRSIIGKTAGDKVYEHFHGKGEKNENNNRQREGDKAEDPSGS